MTSSTTMTAAIKINLPQNQKSDYFSSEEIIAAVYESGLKMLAPTYEEELYSLVVKELTYLVKAAYVSIYIVKKGTLRKVFTTYEKLKDIYPRKDGFTYKAFSEAIPYILDNRNVLTIHPEVQRLGIKSTLFIPLTFDVEPVGVISVDFLKKTKLPNYILQALKLFGSIITFKLRNIQLHSQLKEMIENQNLFMSLASHELRNPLTAVQAYAALIQRQVKQGKHIQPRTINLLMSEIQRMSDLTHELLDSNKNIKSTSLQYEKKNYSLRQIIQHAITNFHLTHPNRIIIFEDKMKNNDSVQADYHKLIQVFSNLFNNAAKFSGKKTKIKVTLQSDDSNVHLMVRDKGKGISPHDIPYIFDQFYKGKSSKAGMGLGLYLCKQIIESHSGMITVTSELKKGTTFVIYLPIYNAK